MPIILALSLVVLGQNSPAASFEVRLVQPQVQGQRILALFEGARTPHPAAALAAYRRAKGGTTGLSKGAEAAIAAINPRMVGELSLLDDATLHLTRTLDGRLAWYALLPHDDGSLGALATAFALTDGASLPPIEGVALDRLGPNGAALMAKAPDALIVANSVDDVAVGVKKSREPRPPQGESGLFAHLDPRLLAASGGSLTARRVGETLLGWGCVGVDGALGLDREVFTATIRGRFSTPAATRSAIDPRWLDATPKDDALAAFALAIDPNPKAWEDLFPLLDRVEKVDPARAQVAPIRLRLGLILRAAKVRPETDIWPILKGVSGFVTVDGEGKVNGVLVRLHTKDEASAGRLANETIPRLVFALRLKTAKTEGVFGFVAGGRTVAVDLRGDSVVLAWGDTLARRSLGAAADPAISAGPGLRDGLDPSVQRFVAFWPGRLKVIAVPEAPPAIWSGRIEGDRSFDQIRWPGLKLIVKRVLARLPLDPPPDAATPINPGRN